MSAPKTDIEEQEAKHRPALLGMKAVFIYSTILLVGFIIWIVARGEEPRDVGAEVDGRTGEIEAPAE